MFALFFESFPECRDSVDVETWLHAPGLPIWMPDLSAGDQLTKAVDTLVRKWELAMTGEIKKEAESAKLLLQGGLLIRKQFNPYQVFYFLDELLKTQAVHRDSMIRLGDAYGFIKTDENGNVVPTNNAEIMMRYSQLLIKHNCKDHWELIKTFLLSQGKQKYTLPVWRVLCAEHKDRFWKNRANEWWPEFQPLLHPNVRNNVSKILFKSGVC